MCSTVWLSAYDWSYMFLWKNIYAKWESFLPNKITKLLLLDRYFDQTYYRTDIEQTILPDRYWTNYITWTILNKLLPDRYRKTILLDRYWTNYITWTILNKLYYLTDIEQTILPDRYWTNYITWPILNTLYYLTNIEQTILPDQYWTNYITWPIFNKLYYLTDI